MKKTYYITLAIDYVNAKPHIGHAVEKVQADVLARFHRILGEETFFLGGTDEFSLKNVQAAEKVGMTVEVFVEKNAKNFYDTWKSLNVSLDDFIRTTEERHVKGVQKFWSLFGEGDLYKKRYEGWYCVGCEEFKMEKDLLDGKCNEHPNAQLEKVKEENWFFRLSKYQGMLEQVIDKGELQIFPRHRKNEVLAFIRGGLEDFSVSRSLQRAKGWGVPVPDDPDQVMYVWVDALANYITGLDFASNGERYKTFWEGDGERMHLIGKGILRFHAVYWPAMLLSANLPIPKTIYAHEYLSINGQKISKSLGNVINPEEVVEKYGCDGARYVLLTALPYMNDGDVSWDSMTERYNADLANGLGNLVSRVAKLLEGTSLVPVEPVAFSQEYVDLLGEMRFSEALEFVMAKVRSANKTIEDTKPWELKKSDTDRFIRVMTGLVSDIMDITKHIEPFLPGTADRIKKIFSGGEREILFQRIT